MIVINYLHKLEKKGKKATELQNKAGKKRKQSLYLARQPLRSWGTLL